MIRYPILALAAAALAGCVGAADDPSLGSAASGISLAGQSFRKLDDPSWKLAGPRAPKEHCRPPAARIADGTFAAGEQLKLYRGGVLTGLCTVEAGGSSADVYLVPPDVFTIRLSVTDTTVTQVDDVTVVSEYAAGFAPVVARPAASSADSVAGAADDVAEYIDRAAGAKVAYTAPHSFERGTREEASAIHDADPARNALWVAGYATGSIKQDTFDRLHITSTDFSPASFPRLGTLLASPLPYAVSFHGHGTTCPTDLVVGGGVEDLFRRGVAETLRDALPGLTVEWNAANLSSACDLGAASANFVNAIAAGHRGLQLEQSSLARVSYGTTIASTVRQIYDCLLDPADIAGAPGVQRVTSGFQTTGCSAWIGEVTIPAGTTVGRFDVGAVTACGSAHAHTDIYHQRADGAWERVGGGFIDYTGDGTTCTMTWAADYQQVPVPFTAGGTYRAVVRATSSAGVPLAGIIQWG